MNIRQLTFTRFIAAILIVIYHFRKGVFPFDSWPIYLFSDLNLAVSYFFVLSGFVMLITYNRLEKIDFFQYIKKRLVRIYPAYLLATLLVLLYWFFYLSKIDYSGFVLNLLLIQAWIPVKALAFNYPAWAIAIEFFFYLTFPFLFNYIYKRHKFRKVFFLIVSFWILSQVVIQFFWLNLRPGGTLAELNFVRFFPLFHLNQFLIGNLAGLCFLKFRENIADHKKFLLLIFILISGVLLFFDFNLFYKDGLAAPILALFLIILSSSNNFFTRFLSFRPLIFLGELSYGIYIFQKPVFNWVYKILSLFGHNSVTLNFYISFLVLIFVAVLSFIFIEKPLRERMKKKQEQFLPRKTIFNLKKPAIKLR